MLEEGRAREEGEARRAEAEQAREDAEEMAVQAGQREDEVHKKQRPPMTLQ